MNVSAREREAGRRGKRGREKERRGRREMKKKGKERVGRRGSSLVLNLPLYAANWISRLESKVYFLVLA